MRITLGQLVWVAGFLVATSLTSTAQAQYVRTSVAFFSGRGFTSMTVQPVVVPPSRGAATSGGSGQVSDGRNDAAKVGWGKDGFSWGRGYRNSDYYYLRSASTSRGTTSLRAMDTRDAEYRPIRFRVR